MRALTAVIVLTLSNCFGGSPPVDAGDFDCEDLVCTGDQVCLIGVGGAPPLPGESGVHPQCVDMTEACVDDWTCACLAAEGLCPTGPSDCDDSGTGLVCTTYYP